MTLRITAQAIYDELTARGINVQVVPLSLTQALIFDYRGKMRTIIGANPDVSSASVGTISQNKDLTYDIVTRNKLTTVPATEIYTDDIQANNFLKANGKIVVKPVDSAHGNGVTTNITTASQIKHAVDTALKFSESKRVILQQQISGLDLRILIIDGECMGVVRREPASVIGNGIDTVVQLIEYENTHNHDRGFKPYTKKLNRIDLNAVERYLTKKHLSDIPSKGEIYQVVGTANIGTGGRSVECRMDVPKPIIDQAISIMKITGAFICGVDFLYDKQNSTWFLLEINTSPSFGMHMAPSEGQELTDLPKRYVDKLLRKYD